MGRWRRRVHETAEGAGKKGSSESSRPTRLEEQTAGRWEPFENWAKTNWSPKGQSLRHERDLDQHHPVQLPPPASAGEQERFGKSGPFPVFFSPVSNLLGQTRGSSVLSFPILQTKLKAQLVKDV